MTKEPTTSVTNVTPPKKTNRSVSQSDLLDHQVHIEIKNMSKSQEVLNSKARPLNRRSSLAVTPSVSVVNLKHSSADNLPQMSSKRFVSPNSSRNFGQPKGRVARCGGDERVGYGVYSNVLEQLVDVAFGLCHWW